MLADTIQLLNPGGSAANITVTMPAALGINVALAAGQERGAWLPVAVLIRSTWR
jgi:hypothetical protein